MEALINGELYFINENGLSPIFNTYDIVRVLDTMVDEPLALVELVEPQGLGDNKPQMGTTVLVPIYLLTKYDEPDPDPLPIEPEPEPLPEPEDNPEHVEPSPEPEEPFDPNIEPEIPVEPTPEEPEPVLPNVDEESEEQE